MEADISALDWEIANYEKNKAASSSDIDSLDYEDSIINEEKQIYRPFVQDL